MSVSQNIVDFRLQLSPRVLPVAGSLFVAASIFSVVAVGNGFPLVFPDSGGYAATQAPTFRSPFYSILILFFHMRVSLWPVVFMQALVVAHVLYVVTRVFFGGGDTRRFLILAVLMTGLTSLPWFSGQIMPDLFAPILVLGLTLLAFGRSRMVRLERAYFFILVSGSIAVHTTHLPLAAGLVLVLLGISVILRQWDNFRIGNLGLVAGPALLAGLALVSVNLVVHGSAAISPGGSGFLLARSFEDGPAYQYLQDVCPEAGYELCHHLDELPQDTEAFLWGDDSYFGKVNGFVSLQDEAGVIVREAVKAYPRLQAEAILRHWLEQLVTFRTAAEMISYADNTAPSLELAEVFPDAYPAYENSRQGRSEIPIELLGQLGNIVIAVSSVVGLLLTALYWRRKHWLPVILFGSIVMALVGNALLTGGLSGVFDRYQSRLVWLVAFYAFAGLLWLNADRGGIRQKMRNR